MSICEDCGRTILWGVTADGKKIPLDLRPPVYRIIDEELGVSDSRRVAPCIWMEMSRRGWGRVVVPQVTTTDRQASATNKMAMGSGMTPPPHETRLAER